MKITNIVLEWKLEDFWIGAFWKTTKCKTDFGEKLFSVDIWVCLVPCLPLHITLINRILLESKDGT
jgi:hypothetical protein